MKRKELTIKKEISFNLNLHSKELYVHSKRKKSNQWVFTKRRKIIRSDLCI